MTAAVPSIQVQTEFYNDHWSRTEYANHFGLERCIFILENYLRQRLEQPRFLDLGCGTGWLTGVLSAFGPATGVELSDHAMRFARTRFPHAEFIAADVMNWQWDGPPFDIVVSQEVIEHIPDQAGYLEVAASVLKPGGFLVLTTPNRKTLNALSPDAQREFLWQPIEIILSRPELLSLLSKDFEVVSLSSRILGFGESLPYRFVNSPKIQGLLDRVGLKKSFIDWAHDAGFGMYHTVCARKKARS